MKQTMMGWVVLGWLTAGSLACDSLPTLERDRSSVEDREDEEDPPAKTRPAGTSTAPVATSPSAKLDPCGRLSRCCSAMAKYPDLEQAKPLCQMFWLQEIMIPAARRQSKKKLDDASTRDLCALELAQLGTLWMAYQADHPKAGKIPAVCDYTHPDAGRMPAAQ